MKDAASPGKWLLSELTRGYKGTTAASGASGAAVSLKSRAFVQALCRPNVSAWIAIDKTLQAVQGCHVTDASISVTKEGAVELTGTLTGLRLSTTAPEIYYALAEATAFATKAILDHLAANGVAIERLTGIGGISQKSPFVMQLLADVTGREISVIDCKQACAMGSVVYATVIAGCYGSVEEAQRALCNFPARRYTPRDERHPLLMQRYERYKAQGGLPQR